MRYSHEDPFHRKQFFSGRPPLAPFAGSGGRNGYAYPESLRPRCSLQKHWENLHSDSAAYCYEPDGIHTEEKISISQALAQDVWDVITLQQASYHGGMPETYSPYLDELAAYIRRQCPEARLYFHQTWAYDRDCTLPGFANYQYDQQEMFRRTRDTALWAADRIQAQVIPAGTVIQTLREQVPAFRYPGPGMSLCRDTFHLSFDYGRFAAAACWFKTLTGRLPKIDTFQDMHPPLLGQILDVIDTL